MSSSTLPHTATAPSVEAVLRARFPRRLGTKSDDYLAAWIDLLLERGAEPSDAKPAVPASAFEAAVTSARRTALALAGGTPRTRGQA